MRNKLNKFLNTLWNKSLLKIPFSIPTNGTFILSIHTLKSQEKTGHSETMLTLLQILKLNRLRFSQTETEPFGNDTLMFTS